MKAIASVVAIAATAAVFSCAHPPPLTETPASADRSGSALRQYAQLMGGIGSAEVGPLTEPARLDADFYRDALAAGVAEVALSEHAAKHAQSAEVRALAGMLARNHIESNIRLSETSGMRWSRIRIEDREALDDLAERDGIDYEIAYLRLMGMRHSDSIALFERVAAHAVDQRSRALAEATLRMLRAHAAMIASLLERRLSDQ